MSIPHRDADPVASTLHLVAPVGPKPSSGTAASPRVNGGVVELRIADLVSTSLRERGLEPGHVRALAELVGRWPPVLVGRDDHRLIDGHHRVAAARSLGHLTIAAELFAGTPEEGYVEFVRRNVVHGMPLTLRERRHAAARILRNLGEWSDRKIAATCALSPRTVASIRVMVTSAHAAEQSGQQPTVLEHRVGKDGRRRPTDATRTRRQIIQALSADPAASLRAIAERVGVSPETVRTVRQGLEAESVGVEPRPTPPKEEVAPEQPRGEWWTTDAALMSTEHGRRLAQWLSCTIIEDEHWREPVAAAPVSRVYELAAEARRRSASWMRVAEIFETKALHHRNAR